MKNNSPECIARNVLCVFEHPNVEQIVKNGRVVVMNEFSFEAAVETYKKLLTEIM